MAVAGAVWLGNLCDVAVREFLPSVVKENGILVPSSTGGPDGNAIPAEGLLYESAGNSREISGSFENTVLIRLQKGAHRMGTVVHQRCDELALHILELQNGKIPVAVAGVVGALDPEAKGGLQVSVDIDPALSFSKSKAGRAHGGYSLGGRLSTGSQENGLKEPEFLWVIPGFAPIVGGGVVVCYGENDVLRRNTGGLSQLHLQIRDGGNVTELVDRK